MYVLRIPATVESHIAKRCKKDRQLLAKMSRSLDKLVIDPFYPGLKSHKILAKKTGKPAMASWVDGEYRILWEIEKENTIDIIDFGTHKEIYL